MTGPLGLAADRIAATAAVPPGRTSVGRLALMIARFRLWRRLRRARALRVPVAVEYRQAGQRLTRDAGRLSGTLRRAQGRLRRSFWALWLELHWRRIATILAFLLLAAMAYVFRDPIQEMIHDVIDGLLTLLDPSAAPQTTPAGAPVP